MKPHFQFWSNGEVIVYYKGVKYAYGTDAIHHDRWKKLVKYKPMKVWNEVKNGTFLYRDPPLEKKEKPKSQQRHFDF